MLEDDEEMVEVKTPLRLRSWFMRGGVEEVGR